VGFPGVCFFFFGAAFVARNGPQATSPAANANELGQGPLFRLSIAKRKACFKGKMTHHRSFRENVPSFMEKQVGPARDSDGLSALIRFFWPNGGIPSRKAYRKDGAKKGGTRAMMAVYD